MELRVLSDLAQTLNVARARKAAPSEAGRIEIRPSYDRAKGTLEVRYWGRLQGTIVGTLAAVVDREENTLVETLVGYSPARGNEAFAGDLKRNDMGLYSGQGVQVLVAVVDEEGNLIGDGIDFRIP